MWLRRTALKIPSIKRRAEQTVLPTAEEDGMFLDPLEELYRKPDPTMADGQNLTSMYGRFPQELLGCQIEDIDFYYRSKKVSSWGEI